MSTSVSLCNVSLLSISAQNSINSFNDGSKEANACSQLYGYVFGLLARTARWNCLWTQQTLTLTLAAKGTPENPTGALGPNPPYPWLYQYVYPSDCIAMRYLVPTFPNNGVNAVPFTTASFTQQPALPMPRGIPFLVGSAKDAQNTPIQMLLTNQSQAQAVYTLNQQNPVAWDTLFQGAFVSSLAVYLAYALNCNVAMAAAKMKEVEATIMQARISDGNEGVHSQDSIPDWIQARNYGVVPGLSNTLGYCFYPCADMVWPGGG